MSCYRVSIGEFTNNKELQRLLSDEGRVFQQIEFLKALGGELEFIVCTQNKQISGILPLVTSRKAGFKAYHKPPYAHVYGPLIAKKFQKEASAIVSELLSSIDKFALAEFKLPIPDQDILPYIKAGATILTNQTHIVPGGSNYGADSIHSSKRRYLKKLEKKLETGNLILEEGKDCNERILWLQEQVAKSNGFRSYKSTLKSIMNNLESNQAYSFLISTSQGDPVAGAFCPYDNFFAYHLVNASIRHTDNLLNRSNILTTYLAVLKAMEMGLSFDFEGSSISGVASFYRMMGGQPSVHYRIELPKNILGRAYFALRYF